MKPTDTEHVQVKRALSDPNLHLLLVPLVKSLFTSKAAYLIVRRFSLPVPYLTQGKTLAPWKVCEHDGGTMLQQTQQLPWCQLLHLLQGPRQRHKGLSHWPGLSLQALDSRSAFSNSSRPDGEKQTGGRTAPFRSGLLWKSDPLQEEVPCVFVKTSVQQIKTSTQQCKWWITQFPLTILFYLHCCTVASALTSGRQVPADFPQQRMCMCHSLLWIQKPFCYSHPKHWSVGCNLGDPCRSPECPVNVGGMRERKLQQTGLGIGQWLSDAGQLPLGRFLIATTTVSHGSTAGLMTGTGSVEPEKWESECPEICHRITLAFNLLFS